MFPHSDFIVVFVITFFVALRLFNVILRGGKNLPPGRTPWPLFGNLPSLLWKEPHKLITEIAKQYDVGVVTIHLGTSPVIVISRLDQAVEAYIKEGIAFSNRRITPFLERVLFPQGVLFENGKTWSMHRRNIHRGIRCIDRSAEVNLASKVLSEMREVFAKLDKFNCPIDLSESLKLTTAKLACSVSFGGHSDTLTESEVLKDFLSTVQETGQSATPFSLSAVIPSLYDSFLYDKVRAGVENIKTFLNNIFLEHKELHRVGQIRDIMDVYCDKQSCADERHVWRTVLDLLAAGTETTAHTLLWSVMCMCAYPEYQEQIYEELFRVCGDVYVNSMDLRNKLPLTYATLLEVMRLVPVAPLGLPRVASRDVRLGGYDIPKGTEIWLNQYAIHHDEDLWEEPGVFSPERFLNPSKTAVLLEAKNRLVPFGLGRRICIGKKLAETELFLIFSNLFKRYRMRFAGPKDRFDLVGVFGLTYSPKPFKVVLEMR